MNIEQAGRFKDAPWFPKEDTFVIVGGAGGISSWYSLLLARAGFIPMIYDFDTYEVHNISGQCVPTRLIGKVKVEALAEVIKDFTDTEAHIFNEKYTKDSMSHHYVSTGFDNMEARKAAFEAWVNYIAENKEDLDKEGITPLFQDGRLLLEQMQIFNVTPATIEAYKEHLFDDAEVKEAPCTLKQTSHSAAMIASHMVAFFTNHMTNVTNKSDERVVPFQWEYFIPLDMITVE